LEPSPRDFDCEIANKFSGTDPNAPKAEQPDTCERSARALRACTGDVLPHLDNSICFEISFTRLSWQLRVQRGGT
jgi:hypothetical protein